MATNNLLKDRFERLQKATTVAPENTRQEVAMEPAKLELSESKNLEIHQTVRAAKGTHFDWKSRSREGLARPKISNERNVAMFEIEKSLQTIRKDGIVISFSYSEILNREAKTFVNFVKARPMFWAKLLNGVENVHIYCEKGKICLSLRFDQFNTHFKNNIKSILEEEYTGGSRNLRSFSVRNNQEWSEVVIEITATDGKGMGATL